MKEKHADAPFCELTVSLPFVLSVRMVPPVPGHGFTVAILPLKSSSSTLGNVTTTLFGVFLQGFISGTFGIVAAILVLYLLKNEELKEVGKALKTKFWKTKVIAPAQEGL